MAGDEERFTLPEITEALVGLDQDAQRAVFGALQQISEGRQQRAEQAGRLERFVPFVKAYHRVNAEGRSDSDIEGLTENLQDEAGEVLEYFATHRPAGDAAHLVRQTAAYMYPVMMVETNDADETELSVLISNAGFDFGLIRHHIAQVIADVHTTTPEDKAALINQFMSEEMIEWQGWLNENVWKQLIDPLAVRMRAAFLEAGVRLPELNEFGKYDGEDDD
jgi:hypothetical protein